MKYYSWKNKEGMENNTTIVADNNVWARVVDKYTEQRFAKERDDL